MKRNICLICACIILSGCASIERSWQGKVTPVYQRLDELVKVGTPITIAVLGTVETSFSPEAFKAQGLDMDQWKKTIKQEIEGRIEAGVFNKFGAATNLKFVDRNNIDRVFQEMKLAFTGVLSNEDRLQLGKLLGASHFMTYQFNRMPAKRGIDDHIVSRLIEVETGTILATQWQTIHK